MSKACVFLANGLEECEGLVTIDILRRAGVEVTTASIHEDKLISSSHNISFYADALASDLNMAQFDMVVLPGETPAEVISAIIADEAAIGVINQKTTAVRIIPATGKKLGERIDFGGLLGTAPVMPLHSGSSAEFIARGGRIPAPMHSLKN